MGLCMPVSMTVYGKNNKFGEGIPCSVRLGWRLELGHDVTGCDSGVIVRAASFSTEEAKGWRPGAEA